MEKELSEIRELTKAELQIMLIVWEREQVFVNDVIAFMGEPKPAYTTVSTMLKILTDKKFLSYRVFGRNYQYYALISKRDYLIRYMRQIEHNFFSGSAKNLISFLISDSELSDEDRDELLHILKLSSIKL